LGATFQTDIQTGNSRETRFVSLLSTGYPLDINSELNQILCKELGVEVYKLVTGSLPLNFQPNVNPETIPPDYKPFEIIY